MKKYSVVVLAIIALISTSACSNMEKDVQERIKPVKTIEVKEQQSPVVLSYSGIVASDELKRLSFKSTGKVKEIHFKAGELVKKGDVLVELEEQDLQYALAAARAQMGAAQSTYEKAMNGATTEELRNAELNVKKGQDAYDYILSSYKRIEALYSSGAASKNELEKAKLEADVKESELNQAKELLSQVKTGARSEDEEALQNQLEQAKADYEYKASLVKDAVMEADCDGFIVEVLYEKGELVPAGYPVAVVRNQGLVVNVGLAEKDCSRVIPGTKADISAGGKTVEGTVTSISQVPDSQTGAYNIEIAIQEEMLNIGAVAKVEIITGNETGIWIPLTSMLSDGMDYVYLAKDNVAEKREITIESIAGSMARIKGLESGEQLVIEGMKRLRAGDGISVVK
jgi:multidrug resistance efflux pump